MSILVAGQVPGISASHCRLHGTLARKRVWEEVRSGKPVQQFFHLLYYLAISFGEEAVAVKKDGG